MLLKQALNTNLAQCELRVSDGSHLLSGPEVLQGHTLAAVIFQVVAGGDLHTGGRGTGQHLSALAQKATSLQSSAPYPAVLLFQAILSPNQ